MKALAALAALLVLAAVPAAAHGPPAPRDHEVRLLVDHNDDCGGDDAGSLANCHGTHDLVSLDLREAYDADLGDVLVFRFLLNGGDAPKGLRDVLSLTADGAPKTLEISTTDNRAFLGSGFDRVSPAMPIHDGTRFAVEATVQRADLGLAVGERVAGFRVDAYEGTRRGDTMPGGYVTALGVENPNPPQGTGATNYVRPDYALCGPTYYASLEAPASAEVAPGARHAVRLEVANLLRDAPQTLTFTAAGADGVAAGFSAGTGGDDAPTLQLALAKRGSAGGSATVELALRGERQGATGTITVAVTTDLGGRVTAAIPYAVAPGGSPQPQPSEPPSGGKGSPAPALPLLGAALLAMAASLGRRSAP